MALNRMTLLAHRHTNFYAVVNGFHTSCVRPLDQDWRAKRKLPSNPNSIGPLTNLPDYSFKDGRPTPLCSGQRRRIDKQEELAKQIIKLVGEVDYAVERHAKLQREQQEERQRIIDNKLKPKGKLLLTVNNKI